MKDIISFDVKLTPNQKLAQDKLNQVHQLYDEIEKLLGTQDVFKRPHLFMTLPPKKEKQTNEEWLRQANKEEMEHTMKCCPKCKGEGQIIKKEKGTIGYIARLGICDKCHGSGEVEMTNEDYLRSCNTEELAIFICNNLPQETEGTLENRFWNALYSQYPIEPMNAYHEVMKWLKEEYNK